MVIARAVVSASSGCLVPFGKSELSAMARRNEREELAKRAVPDFAVGR